MTQDSTPIKYFLYTRKSTEEKERQILSLESREEAMRKIAERENLKIVKIYRESKSAKEPDKRPVFAEMIARIRCGEANGILCWKLDRLARNPDEASMIIDMLQRYEIRHMSELYRILTNPFYYGWYEWKAGSGNWIHDLHEPLICENEYDHIQHLLGEKRETPSQDAQVRVHWPHAMRELRRFNHCRGKIQEAEKWQCPSLRLLPLHEETQPALHGKSYRSERVEQTG